MHVSHMMIKKLELVNNFRDMKLQEKLGANFIRCSYLVIF